MICVCMIMSVLVPATLATGIMECNLTDEDQQCYGVLGEPLLPDHARMTLKYNNSVVFKLVNNNLLEMHLKYNTCWKFFINGTFMCDKTTKNDSGVYQLKLYNTNGKMNKIININLQILAPVSHPFMFQTCLSPELMAINCSTDGDVTEFSVFLDDNTLIQINTSRAKRKSITFSLNGQLTGNLQCKVQNKVSSKQIAMHFAGCKGAYSLTMTVLASMNIPLLLLIAILGIKVLKKRRSPTSIREDNTEDEIVYSDVRVNRAARKMDV